MKTYETPELEIILFDTDDVIATSIIDGGGDGWGDDGRGDE